MSDLKVWNYDGSSTGQADGHNSEVLLKPRAIFNDCFRDSVKHFVGFQLIFGDYIKLRFFFTDNLVYLYIYIYSK